MLALTSVFRPVGPILVQLFLGGGCGPIVIGQAAECDGSGTAGEGLALLQPVVA
jgi:hypothetical protein